ncbi:MAG: PP2C family protein-serine/threonine phosphatase [Candidatus Saccharimonadales bacterium]
MERAPFSTNGIYESRALQPFSLDIGLAESSLFGPGEDRSLVRKDEAFFAVFDGVRFVPNGGLAAEVALDSLSDIPLCSFDGANVEDITGLELNLKSMVQRASFDVANEADGGITTCVAARIISVEENDQRLKPYVVWAAAGDSRIYVYSGGKVDQLSRDEGNGRTVSNYLGQKDYPKIPATVEQAGHRRLNWGDKILLVTDGITGDEDTLLTDEEISMACANAPEVAAGELIKISRLKADKTALVVGIAALS